MSSIDKTWFRELNDMWAGYCVSLEIEEILFQEKSKYQDILIFKSKSFGNVLVLDGIIQCSERDEFAYQEMIAHIPLSCHPNPKKVLVVGGGDGGVVREVLKHPSVQSVILCEIDQMVIDACKKFLPVMAQSFDDPRLTVHVGDGVKFMKDHKGEFDVIITDAPDPIETATTLRKMLSRKKFNQAKYRQWSPTAMLNAMQAIKDKNVSVRKAAKLYDVQLTTLRDRVDGRCSVETVKSGPEPLFSQEEEVRLVNFVSYMASLGYGLSRTQVLEVASDLAIYLGAAAGLFEEEYYQNMKAALNSNGIICCQGENMYLDLPLIKKMLGFSQKMFPKIGYAYTMMPTYTGGHIGFVLCSNSPNTNFK
ncbi:hypothetical protein KUTeg_010367 [Tegillarca granosa]|uniref:PABS domain-containing protein n=1 Tax=Tegillarca granosa TaxID=220873 RepID=A0ABQ9F6I2_TEGGR|nr:hypothetical protein KUTeg_010367 [Tegillarca granosa]